jgi:hypothetical protein
MNLIYVIPLALLILSVWWTNRQFKKKREERWQDGYEEGYRAGIAELNKRKKGSN